ncbi:hypothetical protein [Psychromonas sp. CD1]|uniref:hypothetical protein n=1 Tax=Psychromonas sp. CD1 TaxID=1979839 RepID=UPI000B9B361C|nr:hypothetical protein [Psychromonas sp. CD1]
MFKSRVIGISFIEILVSLWVVSLAILSTLGLQKSLNTQQSNNMSYVGALSLFNDQFASIFNASTVHISLKEEVYVLGQTQYRINKEIKHISIYDQNMSAIKISIYWLDFNAQEKVYSLTKLIRKIP